MIANDSYPKTLHVQSFYQSVFILFLFQHCDAVHNINSVDQLDFINRTDRARHLSKDRHLQQIQDKVKVLKNYFIFQKKLNKA